MRPWERPEPVFTSLVLVGCGKMGGALLSGWLDRGLDASRIHVVEPDPGIGADVSSRHGIDVRKTPTDLGPDVSADAAPHSAPDVR